MAFRCLSEYANVRATYFTDKNTKNQFIIGFVQQLVTMFSNEIGQNNPLLICIFSNISILREVLKIIFKFHDNFGVRGLVNCEIEEVLDQYLLCIYQFTIEAFSCNLPNKKQVIQELMAYINQTWYRIILEVVQCKTQN